MAMRFLAILILVSGVEPHGRLIEPPSRSTMWRYGFNTPPNYNDHELYCGGFSRQWRTNGGKCGICGDPWDTKTPRANEAGGRYGKGIIARKYTQDDIITIQVELTANHMGYFEFRICPNNNKWKRASQTCLDKYLLQKSGTIGTRYYPGPGAKVFEMKYQLPEGLTCTQCVLQWRYVAGNNWGTCKNGTGAVGCGPQEEFRACSDISITKSDGSADNTVNKLEDPDEYIPTLSPIDTNDLDDLDDDDDDDTNDVINEIDSDLYDSEAVPSKTLHYTPLHSIALILFLSILFTSLFFGILFCYFLRGKQMARQLRKRKKFSNPKALSSIKNFLIGSIKPGDSTTSPTTSTTTTAAAAANLNFMSKNHDSKLMTKKKVVTISEPAAIIFNETASHPPVPKAPPRAKKQNNVEKENSFYLPHHHHHRRPEIGSPTSVTINGVAVAPGADEAVIARARFAVTDSSGNNSPVPPPPPSTEPPSL